jgi:hypothetical protein
MKKRGMENMEWNSMFGRVIEIINEGFESRGGKRW